jgi:hypothetical protein
VRQIIDLFVPGSLSGFWITKLLKGGLEDLPLLWNGGTMRFVKKPTTSVLTECFEDLISPPLRYTFVYHSDDSCFSVRHNGKIHIFNIDISACDASHGPAIFKMLYDVTPEVGKADMQRLINQCRNHLRFVSPHTPLFSVLIKFLDPRLFSGSTITTLINNLANLIIGCALSECHFDTLRSIDEQVIAVVRRTGYVVTCEPCRQDEDIQFLKNSPAYDTEGRMWPTLNFGVYLRAMGVTKGELNGTGPIKPRAIAHHHQFTQGAYPRTHTPLIDSQRGQLTTYKPLADFEYKVDDDCTPRSLSDHALLKRYNLSEYEFSQVQLLATAGYEDVLSGAGFSVILMKDYGLTSPGG